jgi:N-acetyl-alpha-D-muramate 1-phosphate uridylyltransferase
MINTYILCGGLGTRLGQKYSHIPKCLIKIHGKSFLHWQLEYLEKQKIPKVILCTGHLSNLIKKEMKEKNYKLDIKLSDDGKSLLGTGGAIKKAAEKNKDKIFFIIYGDSFLRVNLEKFFDKYKKVKKLGMMSVIKNKNKWDKSNAYFLNSKNDIFYNKTGVDKKFDYIDYGASIINSKIFKDYPKNNFFDLAGVFNKLSLQDNLAGFKVTKRFYEIGSKTGLNETSKFLKKNLL